MENVYDDLGRLTRKLYTATDGSAYSPAATYSYIDWSSDTSRTTGTVRGIDYSYTSGDLSVSDLYYVYDANGNITAERTWHPDENNPLREKYAYDGKNQLIRHDSATQGKSFAYEYDAGGNILSKSEYDYTTGELGAALNTVSYTYGDSSWGDLLTAYNGQAITYDAIGNPTSYLGWNMTWQGCRLTAATKDENALSFTYDANGIRTSKTVNGVTTEYFLNGSQILAQKTGESTMWFFYDSEGNRIGMIRNGYAFYYMYNLQGDVIGLMDARNGRIVARYSYDAWGNCTVQNADGWITGDANPFRYRGYYYDTETGFYYLNSRYYSPEFGRIINVDSELAGVGGNTQGYNLFAYCFNNPVNMSDPDGNWPKWLTGAANVLSGTLQMAAGSALGAAMGWTGFGAVAAGFLLVNGAATATQGIGQIANSVAGSAVLREDNIVRTGVQAVGRAIGGQTGAKVAGFAYDVAIIAANVYAGQAIRSPSQCFIAGTAVLTVAGNRAIETIKTGDMVWAENPETGEKAPKAVVQTFVNETNELVHVCVNGEELVTTPGHPFYSPVKGWIAACKLRAGDILVLQSGKYVIVEKVQHEILESPIAVYNFEVADFHTYYVGESAVLVHNACGNRNTADQTAVIQLAKEAKKSGLSRTDADILWSWAEEARLSGLRSYHPPMYDSYLGGSQLHIKINGMHINIF